MRLKPGKPGICRPISGHFFEISPHWRIDKALLTPRVRPPERPIPAPNTLSKLTRPTTLPV